MIRMINAYMYANNTSQKSLWDPGQQKKGVNNILQTLYSPSGKPDRTSVDLPDPMVIGGLLSAQSSKTGWAEPPDCSRFDAAADRIRRKELSRNGGCGLLGSRSWF